MGDDWHPDAAIISLVMHKVMKRVEVDLIDADIYMEMRYLTRAGLFFLAAYLGSIRGKEVPRLLRKEFIELNFDSLQARIPHCVLPLYGNFKNNSGIVRCYLFRIALVSKTGFDMRKWVQRVMDLE